MFYVLLTGSGEGCDHSIGCNMRWQKLRASTFKEAEEEVSNLVDLFTHIPIKNALILDVASYGDFDIKLDRELKEARQRKEQEQTDRAKRKSEYDKLRPEFEKSIYSDGVVSG